MNKFHRGIYYLLVKNKIVDNDEAEAMCDNDSFMELYDEDNFQKVMGNVPVTEDNILSYYEKCPEDLDQIVDALREDYHYHHWNVNWWRNNN